MSAHHASYFCRIRRKLKPIVLVALTAALAPGKSSAFLSAEDFFREPSLVGIRVSPSGEFLVVEAHHSTRGSPLVLKDGRYVLQTGEDLRRTKTTILIRHNESKAIDSAVSFWGSLNYLGWADDDTLIVSFGTTDEYVRAIDVSFVDGALKFRTRSIEIPGIMIDEIANQEDHILWAYNTKSKSYVYNAPISKLVSADPTKGRKRWRGMARKYTVAKLDGKIVWWITDRDGVVRGALGVEEGDPPTVILWYRENGDEPWREVYRTDDLDELIIPLGITHDNRNLLVLSDQGRDTKALVEFEIDKSKLGRVIFSHPDADVEDIIYDFSGMEVLSAVYQESGLRKYHHFDAFNDRFQRSLEHAFQDQVVAITSTSRDSRYFSVFVTSPRNPGAFYILDTQEKSADFIGRAMPWIDPEELADVQVFEVASADGMKIEAFLTLPVNPTEKLPPLLVLPHGGPLGVRDDREFNSFVQYLASWGISVLQVNFRGSAGYGKKFFEAGFRERARGIEDDIQAAVELVVDRGLVDSKRMCIAGMSYGGYSALISVMRYPEQYLCAVTIAGVTDIPLFLNSTGIADTQEGREALAKLIGDPDTEYEELISISPAYRVGEITVPLLIIHGTQDRRVDIEHAYRLMAMLNARGKGYSWYPLEGAGHSPSVIQWVELARTLSSFVDDYLHPLSSEPQSYREQ